MKPSAHGFGHVFERHSVAPEHKIWEAALVKGCGQLDLRQLKNELNEERTSSVSARSFPRGRFSAKELYLIRAVNAGVEALKPIAGRLRTVLAPRPGPAQGSGPCSHQPRPVHRIPRPGWFGQKHAAPTADSESADPYRPWGASPPPGTMNQSVRRPVGRPTLLRCRRHREAIDIHADGSNRDRL